MDACPANIGGREITVRRVTGVVGLALGAVLSILFVAMDVRRIVRLTVLLPWIFGFLGVLQARGRV